jgi:hypothetical protein
MLAIWYAQYPAAKVSMILSPTADYQAAPIGWQNNLATFINTVRTNQSYPITLSNYDVNQSKYTTNMYIVEDETDFLVNTMGFTDGAVPNYDSPAAYYAGTPPMPATGGCGAMKAICPVPPTVVPGNPYVQYSLDSPNRWENMLGRDISNNWMPSINFAKPIGLHAFPCYTGGLPDPYSMCGALAYERLPKTAIINATRTGSGIAGKLVDKNGVGIAGATILINRPGGSPSAYPVTRTLVSGTVPAVPASGDPNIINGPMFGQLGVSLNNGSTGGNVQNGTNDVVMGPFNYYEAPQTSGTPAWGTPVTFDLGAILALPQNFGGRNGYAQAKSYPNGKTATEINLPRQCNLHYVASSPTQKFSVVPGKMFRLDLDLDTENGQSMYGQFDLYFVYQKVDNTKVPPKTSYVTVPGNDGRPNNGTNQKALLGLVYSILDQTQLQQVTTAGDGTFVAANSAVLNELNPCLYADYAGDATHRFTRWMSCGRPQGF